MMIGEKKKIWALGPAASADPAAARELAAQTGLSPVTARLLIGRGYDTAEKVKAFIHCEDVPFHDPFLMRDMDKAADRLLLAVRRGERIVIYGDYDVDGVTSVSLLYLFLRQRGADVSYYIPCRDKEGYGLSSDVIEQLAKDGVCLIVTVDTGITANDEAARARELGVDMIVTDHHECRLPLPEAVAVVDPHRPDCAYPFTDLAGVGVAYKLATACAVLEARERGEDPAAAVLRVGRDCADLVAVGTVADVMPLCGENRLIVKEGLACIEDPARLRLGLRALMEEAAGRYAGETRPARRKITASYIGFTLAPRLNAAGRMQSATLAAELLLSDAPEEARKKAGELCELNSRRQAEENRIVDQALERIDNEPEEAHARVIVLEDDGWPQGIIGIVASRLTERYGRPAILISFDGNTRGFKSPDDRGKGSGRSVPGFNLVGALTACEDLLERFGGHELAAGLTVRRDRVDEFRRRINGYAADYLPAGGIPVTETADLVLPFDEVNVATAADLQRLEPFGVANPKPQFILSDLIVTRILERSGGKHLQLLVSDGRRSASVMCFGTARDRFPFDMGDRVDLLVEMDVSEYRDVPEVQLKAKDIRLSSDLQKTLTEGRLRYAAVRAGGPFSPEEGIVPDRDDCAHVYRVLQKADRAGRHTFSEQALLALVNLDAPRPIGYVCLKYIVEIFHELNICGVQETEDGYRFEIYNLKTKTNIERSSVLRQLKRRCCREEKGDAKTV